MNERIKLIRENLVDANGKKYTQTKFAEEMKVTRDIIATYESGRVAPSSVFIDLLCNKYNVNEEWLRTGSGEMFVPLTKEKEIAQMVKKMYSDELSPEISELIRLLSDMSEEETELFSKIIQRYVNALEAKKNLPEE